MNETDELVHLTIGREIIDTTPSYPFYVAQKGWYAAESLRAGDILVTVNGGYVILEQVQHEIFEQPVTVYNFEVRDYHTYIVSEIQICVHNLCVEQSQENRSGQWHHPISRKIEKVARKNDCSYFIMKSRCALRKIRHVQRLCVL